MTLIQKDTVALQISVYDGLGMQVTEGEEQSVIRATALIVRFDSARCLKGYSLHALSGLSGYVDQFDHLELGLDDVQVVVQTGAFTPLGHDGQLGLGGVAHEEQDVHVTRFPGANTRRVQITAGLH